MYKGLIFDFDGTLVRSHEQVFAVLEELSRECGLTLPAAEQFRHLSTAEAIRTLGLHLWQVPRFTVIARQKLNARLGSIEFEPGVIDLLRDMHRLGHLTIGLVSSNSAKNVSTLLEKFKAREVFEHVICGSSILGKQRNILKMIKRMFLTPRDCIYVGDETRDIEASKRAGVKVAAVNWGFHSEEKLRSLNPDYFVETIEDLRSILLGSDR